MKKASVFLWGIASILLYASLSLADLVTLRGGATYKGRVLSLDRTSDQVVIEVPGTGIKVLRFHDVGTILVGMDALPSGGDCGPSAGLPARSKMILEDDAGPYRWLDGSEVQADEVHAGRAAFRSNGNDHFVERLGIAGNYAEHYRFIDFWIFLRNPSADIQLQVQVDGQWGKRWGFDGERTYNGYSWAMEGTTTGLTSGTWLHQRLDLIEQLHIHAGQAITGLAFSSDAGDVLYDSVYLVPTDPPLPPPLVVPQGKEILGDGAGPYAWRDGTVVQKDVVAHGDASFRSDGNDHFEAVLGTVGDYPELFRTISFWLFPIGPEADLQLQVQVDGAWGKRWGLEAGPVYNGYSWPMEGTTTNLRAGQWQEIKLDLIRDLHIYPGQKITGLAFSSDGADCYYDAVYLQPNPHPVSKPLVRPTGRMVLEDDAGIYRWNDATETRDDVVLNGSRAFRSNGNDHFTADLGIAGHGANRFRTISFWAFFMNPQADIQVQVQVNGIWGKRWGFDAEPVYNGYSWGMEGTTTGMPVGRWVEIRLDLLQQLHVNDGDRITGLAFSSDNGDVLYDSVYLEQ